MKENNYGHVDPNIFNNKENGTSILKKCLWDIDGKLP